MRLLFFVFSLFCILFTACHVTIDTTTPPTITLNGKSSLTLSVGDTYTEESAQAKDNTNKDITEDIIISGYVDTDNVGNYEVTYTASDTNGNTAKTTRSVGVEGVAGITVSEVEGSTVNYDETARLTVVLNSQPTSNVAIEITSSNKDEAEVVESSLTHSVDEVERLDRNVGEGSLVRTSIVYPPLPRTHILFTPNNWNTPQEIKLVGRNFDVVGGVQDYSINIGNIKTNDDKYKQLEIESVRVKGIELYFKKHERISTISEIPLYLPLSAYYNGEDTLSYSLVEYPSVTTEIDENTGVISWTPSTNDEGVPHTIKAKVTDGRLSSEVTFEIYIEPTVILNTEINNTTITVVENNHSLNGLALNLSQEVIDNGTNPQDIKIQLIPQELVKQKIPKHLIRMTDFFAVKENIEGELKIRLPLQNLPRGRAFWRARLYTFSFTQNKWRSLITDMNLSGAIDNPIIETAIPKMQGIFFIGIGNDEGTLLSNYDKIDSSMARDFSINDHPVGNKRWQRSDPINPNVRCIREESWFFLLNLDNYFCEIDYNTTSTKQETLKITFHNYEKIVRDRTKSTLDDMMEMLSNSSKKFHAMGLSYRKEFLIEFEIFQVLGKTTAHVDYLEYLKTIHINKEYIYFSKSGFANLLAHEHFHLAQGHTRIQNDERLNVFQSDNLTARWIIEGTAQWFEDELYDLNNSYYHKQKYFLGENSSPNRYYERGMILRAGLNYIPREDSISFNGIKSSYDANENPYLRFSFFKLLNQSCDFSNPTILKKMFNLKESGRNHMSTFVKNRFYWAAINPINRVAFHKIPWHSYDPQYDDATGLKDVASLLSEANCDFGNHFGKNKKSSLEAALGFYQYATVFKDAMEFLDSNEPTDFYFFQTTVVENKIINSDTDQDGTIDTNITNKNPITLYAEKSATPTGIPTAGTESFKVKLLKKQVPPNHIAVIEVKADEPVILSVLDIAKGVLTSDLDGGDHTYIDCAPNGRDATDESKCRLENGNMIHIFAYHYSSLTYPLPNLFFTIINPSLTKSAKITSVKFYLQDTRATKITRSLEHSSILIDPNNKPLAK